MVRMLLWLGVLALMAAGGIAAYAEDGRIPLQFEFELMTTALEDSVRVSFVAHGRNGSEAPLPVCGVFVFGAQYRSADETRTGFDRMRPFHLWVDDYRPTKVFDGDPTVMLPNGRPRAILDCEPVMLSPGEAVSDTFSFSFSKTGFADSPGTIDITGTFVYGDRGDDWNEALKSSASHVKVSLHVP